MSKAKNQPVWVLDLAGYDLHDRHMAALRRAEPVGANTASEARAVFKRIIGMPRLGPGMRVRRAQVTA